MSRLRVDIAGAGPPLVLLHGWAMHGGVFAPLVEQLRDRYTLHMVDLPGHGHNRDSGVPLEAEACAAALCDVLPVAPWCGWSLGGTIALHAAATRPARVPALAMLCATPRFVRAADWQYGLSVEILRDFASGLHEDYRATLERFVALEAFGSEHAKAEIAALRQDLFTRGEPAPSVLIDGLALLESTDLRDALPALQVPSLWLGGRRDRLVDPRAMREAAALAPDARVHVVEHAGHAPFLTHAADVGLALDTFLRDARTGAVGDTPVPGHPRALQSGNSTQP